MTDEAGSRPKVGSTFMSNTVKLMSIAGLVAVAIAVIVSEQSFSGISKLEMLFTEGDLTSFKSINGKESTNPSLTIINHEQGTTIIFTVEKIKAFEGQRIRAETERRLMPGDNNERTVR